MASFAKIRYTALTDVGVKRSHNQDACAVHPATDDTTWRGPGHVFIVADGMGGHAVGEKASAKAVRDIPLTYSKHVTSDGVAAAIRRAFVEANADIFDIGIKNPEFKGLGTTTTALFLRPEGAWIGHVGDSRAYRIRAGKVEQLTFDHSWVWEIARRQGIDPEQLGDFKKNVIIRSLGPDQEVEVDVEGPHPVLAGDTFLLCSDGLSNEVTADEMGAVVCSMSTDDAAKFLIDLANVRGGRDNITCLIVQAPGKPGESVTVPPPPKAPNKFVAVLTKINKFIPWSYLILGIGSLLAIASLFLKTQEDDSALTLFAVSAGFILAGIIGLILHLRKLSSAQASEDQPESDQELHIYKGYDFELNQDIFDRFMLKQDELKTQLLERNGIPLDWEAHQQLNDDAVAKLMNNDLPGAMRLQFKAFSMLASVFNRDRNKEESFKPNWDQKG